MNFFEMAVQSEEFKGAIGILMGWGSELELVRQLEWNKEGYLS